jgi:hypothetical protein
VPPRLSLSRRLLESPVAAVLLDDAADDDTRAVLLLRA